MRGIVTPMYQHEWFGIEFADVAPVSATRLAGGEFYDAFYRKFFERYRGWEELGSEWLQSKRGVAAALAALRLDDGRAPAAVLSVGCGNGCVEHFLMRSHPSLALDVVDISERALRWIRGEIPEQRLYVGRFPECLPPDKKYDFIFVSAFDYSLTTAELVRFIGDARSRLTDGGALLIVSMSVEQAGRSIRRAARYARAAMVRILDAAGMNRNWQFWGWYRSAADYHAAMRAGGFAAVADGFIEGSECAGQRAYYVRGSRS